MVKATGMHTQTLQLQHKHQWLTLKFRGVAGEESQDYGYTFVNQRRRSNSSSKVLGDFKTKFEALDQDPVFEEELHGPSQEEMEEGSTLSKEESTDTSTLGGSIDEEEVVKK